MEQVNELVELAQQLDAAMDDAGSVLSLSISSRGDVTFLVDTDYFIKNFDSADATERSDHDFPIRLESEVEGVRFRAIAHKEEVELLRGLVPDEWIERASGKPRKVHKISFCRQDEDALSTYEKNPSALACE